VKDGFIHKDVVQYLVPANNGTSTSPFSYVEKEQQWAQHRPLGNTWCDITSSRRTAI